MSVAVLTWTRSLLLCPPQLEWVVEGTPGEAVSVEADFGRGGVVTVEVAIPAASL